MAKSFKLTYFNNEDKTSYTVNKSFKDFDEAKHFIREELKDFSGEDNPSYESIKIGYKINENRKLTFSAWGGHHNWTTSEKLDDIKIFDINEDLFKKVTN